MKKDAVVVMCLIFALVAVTLGVEILIGVTHDSDNKVKIQQIQVEGKK